MIKARGGLDRRTALSGWDIAAALGLLAVAFLIERASPANGPKPALQPDDKRDAQSASLAAEEAGRGRHAASPSEIRRDGRISSGESTATSATTAFSRSPPA